MTEPAVEQLQELLSELQSRLGSIVINYETQIAILNVNARKQASMYEKKIEELEELINKLQV